MDFFPLILSFKPHPYSFFSLESSRLIKLSFMIYVLLYHEKSLLKPLEIAILNLLSWELKSAVIEHTNKCQKIFERYY